MRGIRNDRFVYCDYRGGGGFEGHVEMNFYFWYDLWTLMLKKDNSLSLKLYSGTRGLSLCRIFY